MKLWILKPVDGSFMPEGTNPWEPWYDKMFGIVVRAETEEAARALTEEHACGEKEGSGIDPWKDDRYSTCDVLDVTGESEVIIRDIAYA